MNQRSSFSRTKESRRDKIVRSRRDDDFSEDEPRRSSPVSRFKESGENSRSTSRDTLVFRRQGKFAKTGELSPDARGYKGYVHKRTGGDLVVDEGRLKGFLHRLLRDEDKERQASLMRQLRALFQHTDNHKIIQINKDDIISTFEDFIQLGLNSELKQEFILTVGALGVVLGTKAKSLLEWEFLIVSTSKSEDVRILILKSVLEMLKIDAENLSELVPFIMGKLQTALEVADNPELLMAIVNVISEIATGYPSIFSNHFSDTVDILIGWHIDTTQHPQVMDFTSSALVSFRPFWISDLHFTSTLLGQFLEDMESYAEGLPKVKPESKKSILHIKDQSKLNCSTESQSSPEENIAKIKSLIKVLITVLKSIGDLEPLDDNGTISPTFVLQMLKGFLKYVKLTVEYCYYTDLMTSANECIVLLLRLLGEGGALGASDALCSFVVHHPPLPLDSPAHHHHLHSLLCLMVQVVKGLGSHLPTSFVSHMFAATSATRRLRHSPSHKVQRLLIELYHCVLEVKNVSVVEEFYKCLMEDTMEAHSALLSSSTKDTRNCEISFLLSICALLHIGNIKHSLIRMFALKPSYFDLMVNHLQPTNPEFSKKFPALQSAILFTLYSHCQRHSHFVGSSSLVGGLVNPICSSPSSGHLERVVQLMADLLQSTNNSHDTRVLTLKWSIEILESLQCHLLRLVQTQPFSSLLQATIDQGFSHSNVISRLSCQSLHLFLKWSLSSLTDTTLHKCYDLCILRLNCHDSELQDHFASLLAFLPLHLILRGPVVNLTRGDQDPPNSVVGIWTACRGYMGRSASGNFFGHHFRTIAGFILQGKEPKEKKWLVRVQCSCPPPVDVSVRLSSSLLWFWATWEVAQACVHNKLRTPLGKPQETFMAIEAALKSAAKPSKSQDSFYSEAFHVTLLRHHLLLSLLEHLEKQMYNAYEGCATALATPPKTVRTFFRTNKSTCLEWLSRVRATAVSVALQVGSPATALRHALSILQDNSTQWCPELEEALFAAVRSLVLLGCPEAVHGLYVWCRDPLHRKVPWMKGAVEQAAGRLENTVVEYERIFRSLSDTSVGEEAKDEKQMDGKSLGEDAHFKSFLINQMVDCYAKLQDWPEAVKWCEMLENLKPDQNGLSSQQNNLAYLRCLSSFEKGSLNKKEASTCANNLANCGGGGWAMEEQFGRAQRTLLAAAAQIDARARTQEHMKDEISEAKASILKLMKISSLYWPLQMNSLQASLFMSVSAFQNKANPVLLKPKLDPTNCHSSVIGFLLTWENIWYRLNQGSTSGKTQGELVDLYLVGARLARKQHNLKQCGKMISAAVSLLGGKDPLETLQWTPNEQLVRTQRETAKLLFCLGKKDKSCDLLLNSISAVSKHLTDSSTDTLAQLNSRSMLNLVKYMLSDHQGTSKESSSLLNTLLKDIKPTTSLGKHFENGVECVGDSEYVVGQVLRLSVLGCPTFAKSWCTYAAWCYSNGRKIVNNAGSLSILPEEKAKLFELLPENNKEDLGSVISIVTNLHNSSNGEWDNQEMEWSGAEEVRCQLRTLFIPVTEEFLNGVVDVWRGVVGRAYSYYRMAAESYLRFLRLDGQDDDNVTATLRLLRLLVKHASELREVLEEGLEHTPTTPWRGIIPQLFSRLPHPESYVRCSISSLLGRVAQDAPHLIVFPAVVGTLKHTQLQKPLAGLLGACFPEEEDPSSQVKDVLLSSPDSEEDIVEEEDERKTHLMQGCLSALVEQLSDQRTLAEAKGMVHELHRITLLWDELWLGTLNTHHTEVNRRFLNLEKEISKVLNNSHLSKEEKREIIKEKHAVYVKPTLFLLEQLQSICGHPAETPHEHWFQKTFGKMIEDTLEGLNNPKDPSRPQDSWNLFKKLHQHLQQKQSRSHLSMSEVSPVLCSLRSTPIPMPGVHHSSSVRVQSVHNPITILPTKTRPKKIAFQGTDGRRYTYLFKGLEDLHLDERIMQFLSIVNNMFAKSKRHAGKQVFYARHYSVVPLGPRSGLIQWVDGATPLFGLYKRWQQREASAKNSSGNAGTVLRPSEIFYNKLTPLLKEKNITSLDNRKEWPLSVLLEVLKQLMDETADDLLAKELWCSSSSGEEWWEVQQMYNHSTAVMSVIGYIIGLGDRHLDNVLVDLATGEVVHIDYNVCFEKGKNLRVPEKVPFRMTPNIRTALGLTGIEGVFRASCEHVLRIMRSGRETLLTLLEAFVYDPLVDWAPGAEGGYTGAVWGGRWGQEGGKRGMEEEIARSMLAIRVAEMKAQWNKNRDELLCALPLLERLVGEWRCSQLLLQEAEGELQEACQQKALMEEALSNPQHALYTLHNRYDEATIVKTTMKTTKEAVQEKLNECQKWHSLHCDALSAVCGSELGKVLDSGEQIGDTLSVAPAVEFLQSAGQGQLVQQCEQAESELAAALQQRRLSMRNCIELLTTYATIVMQFGPGYKEQNRCFKWQKWLEGLLEDFTSLKCLDILSALRREYGRPESAQAALSLHLQLQTFLTDANAQCMQIVERMRLEGVDDKNIFTKETDLAVLHYITECGQPSYLAFLCVMGEALCAIRKQLFMMENAAKGDGLLELNLWNGFLDEISSACGNLAHCIQLLLDSPLVLSVELKQALIGVKSAHFVFTALEDLCVHFQNIILPEALQSALDPSVLEVVARLDRIIARTGQPLEQLLEQLLETQVMDSRILDTVKKLRNEFESLMQRSEPNITGLNQGQMLLMGLNGLFTKVDSDLEALLSLHPSFNDFCTRPVLRDVFFVRKLQVMQRTFHSCHAISSSLLPPHLPIEQNETTLIQTIRHYAADYVTHMVLGLPSAAVGFALCQMARNLGCDLPPLSSSSEDEVFVGVFKGCIGKHLLEAHVPPLSALVGAAEGAWRKEDLHRRLNQSLMLCRGVQQRAQLQLARFQWLNEDLLPPHAPPTVSSRASLMSEIRKSVGVVVQLDCVVSGAQERFLSLSGGVEQRLKWAAGANPTLAHTQQEMEESIAQTTQHCAHANRVSQELVNVCNSILHFEAMRTRTTEALSSDALFVALINRCKETCELVESCQSQISTTEENLIALKPLDAGVNLEWLSSVMQRVSGALCSCREKLETRRSATNACWETLHFHVAHMHELISVHHKLMSEVRHILRNLAKHEEQQECGAVNEFTSAYRSFSERLSSVMGRLLKDAQEDVEDAPSLLVELPSLTLEARDIYDGLVTLAGSVHAQREGRMTKKDPKTSRCGTPKRSNVTRDPRTGKAMQERNTYATNIWKRIKMKLDGKDPDPNKKSTVSEQVEFMIKEATLPENLAVLYEGWTPWV